MTQEQLETSAYRIRHEFIRRKKQCLRGRDPSRGSQYQNQETWNRAARICADLRATETAYVAAAFQECRLSTGPFPPAMGSAKAAEWYRAYSHACSPSSEAAGQPAQDELQSKIATILRLIEMRTGQPFGPDNPKGLDELLYGLQTTCPLCRAIVGWDVSEVREAFGPKAKTVLEIRKDLYEAGISMGLPVERIMAWTSSN